MRLLDYIYSQLNRFPFFKQFVKFSIVGSTSALINFIVFFIFITGFGVWYLYASMAAFLASVIFNFTANKLWTFRNRQRGHHAVRQMVKYALVTTAGLTINTGIIYGLTEGFGLHPYISWFFATGIVSFWNFGFNRFWTFKVIHGDISDLA